MMLFKNPVFEGITEEEYGAMAEGGTIRRAVYPKGAVLFHTGEQIRCFGILLTGSIHIESNDVWGNRTILHNIAKGQAFAETYAFSQVPMMVDVRAAADCTVLLVDLPALLDTANRSRSWYVKILYNVLRLSTEKNLLWSGRMFCLTAKGIRARVMTYLSAEAVRSGSLTVTIPFDRQQLADYLNVERSALSKELGRMQKEGILTFHKNTFHLLRRPAEEGE